jgi:hypothetical protein
VVHETSLLAVVLVSPSRHNLTREAVVSAALTLGPVRVWRHMWYTLQCCCVVTALGAPAVLGPVVADCSCCFGSRLPTCLVFCCVNVLTACRM